MDADFHFDLRDVRAGWATFHIRHQSDVVALHASSTPHDSIGLLAKSLVLLAAGQDEQAVPIHDEPGVYELRLAREGDHVGLRIVHFPDRKRPSLERTCFAAELPWSSFVRECIGAFERLASTMPSDLYLAEWHHRFPIGPLERLAIQSW